MNLKKEINGEDWILSYGTISRRIQSLYGIMRIGGGMDGELEIKEWAHRMIRQKNYSYVKLIGFIGTNGIIVKVMKAHISILMSRRGQNGSMRVTRSHIIPRRQSYTHVMKRMILRSLRRRIEQLERTLWGES